MSDVSPDDAPVDDALIQYLCDRDVPCPGCGYNLRGLKLNACPECGATFALGLHGHMPGFRGWVGAIIMTCIGMGFSLLLLAGGIMELLLWGFMSWTEFFLLGGFAAIVIGGVAMVVTLIRRRRHI